MIGKCELFAYTVLDLNKVFIDIGSKSTRNPVLQITRTLFSVTDPTTQLLIVSY